MRKIDRKAILRLPRDEQERAQKLLNELEAQYKANPLLRYEPHPKQAEFHESYAGLKCFFGGNRAGKTTAGILDDIIQACDESVIPEPLRAYKKFQPPFHCRIITPGFDIMEGVVFQKLREWTPKSQLVGDRFDKAYEKSRRLLHFKNGSFFDFLSYDQDLDKFSGAAKHRIHYDEEPPFDIRQECRMRLLDYQGADELFTMTPLLGLSHTYETIWEPWEEGKLEDALIVLVDMDDNPHLSEDQKKKLLVGYSKAELEARKSGKFVHFSGLIYPEFDEQKHVIPVAAPPRDARINIGIDPGVRHMAAVIFTYLTPEDQMVVFDELALQGHTVEDVCSAIHIKLAQHKIGKATYIIDPSARNVLHQTGRSDQMEYTKHGIVTILGQNSVPAGINAVKERFENDRLLIMANCKETLHQIVKYRWTLETKRSEHEQKETPIKKDDHCVDALRYVVASNPRSPQKIAQERNLSPLQKAMKEDIEGVNYRKKPIPRTPFGGIFA